MTKDSLTIIAFNCWVGSNSRALLAQLTRWANDEKPDVFCLSEARTHFSVLDDVPGYTRYQESPRAAHSRVVNDTGDSAILIRNDLVSHVTRHSAVSMLLRWVVRQYHRTHTPRHYEYIVLKLHGKRWRIQAAHWPTGGFQSVNRTPFLESARAALKFGLGHPRSVTLTVGDLNARKATLAKWFGKRFKVSGSGIDVCISRGAKRVAHRELEQGVSDAHRGQLYRVTA